MSRVAGVVLALVLIAVLPDVLLACPVCFDARDENRQAFLATTAFLTLLPLGMVAGTGLWLRKRAHDAERASRNVDPGPSSDEVGAG